MEDSGFEKATVEWTIILKEFQKNNLSDVEDSYYFRERARGRGRRRRRGIIIIILEIKGHNHYSLSMTACKWILLLTG